MILYMDTSNLIVKDCKDFVCRHNHYQLVSELYGKAHPVESPCFEFAHAQIFTIYIQLYNFSIHLTVNTQCIQYHLACTQYVHKATIRNIMWSIRSIRQTFSLGCCSCTVTGSILASYIGAGYSKCVQSFCRQTFNLKCCSESCCICLSH